MSGQMRQGAACSRPPRRCLCVAHAGPGGDGMLEPDPGRGGQGPRPAVAADGGDPALPGDGRGRDRPPITASSRANRETIQGANCGAHGAVPRRLSAARAQVHYDRFATALANIYGGDATDAAVCAETAALAEEAAAASGDIAPAGRRSRPARLRAARCRAASARSPSPSAASGRDLTSHIKISLYLHSGAVAARGPARDRLLLAGGLFTFQETARGDPAPDPLQRLCRSPTSASPISAARRSRSPRPRCRA